MPRLREEVGVRLFLILALCFMICAIVSIAHGQDVNSGDTRPRFEIEPSLRLNGGGFNLFSAAITAGLGMEDQHFNWHVSSTYDTATKATYYVNGLPIANPHGDIRAIDASLFGRTNSGWLFGTTVSYDKLQTTLFDKNNFDLGIGIGKDWFHITCPTCNGYASSMRLTVEYALPIHGINRLDQENGFTANYYLPSPIEVNRHVFFHVAAFAGWVCDPNCAHDGSSSLGVLFRF